MDKKDIKNYTLKELQGIMADMEEPSYRARQIFYWLYKKGVISFDEMGNLPGYIIDKFKRHYYISAPQICERLKSSDGTEKFIFKLSDGNYIETVLIYAKDRKTVCLSVQVGCKFACSFCASGLMGFVRDLTPSEIINQTLFLPDRHKHKITNYVFMGMGEPLDNYDNMIKSLLIMNESEGMGIGARRITVSTCGIIPGINKLGKTGLEVNLSISLHVTNDKLRNDLMPVNRIYPLEKLIKACQSYKLKTNRLITLEYILIKDKNHSAVDADRLASIAKRLKAKVNLIRYSNVHSIGYRSPRYKDIDIFVKRLTGQGVNVTLRRSKGSDIKAACGQLAGGRAGKCIR